jgi:hypothetical protein
VVVAGALPTRLTADAGLAEVRNYGRGADAIFRIMEHDHIEAMRAVFHKVCDALSLNGHVDDPMTELVVNKIVALAEAGKHDADQLAEHVLNDLVDDGLPPPSDKPRHDPSPQV